MSFPSYDPSVVLFALLGGVFPALLWLWFWLKEDRTCPEPRHLIMMSFCAGAAMVPLAAYIEQKTSMVIYDGGFRTIVWAAIEESLKFLAAYITVLRNKEMNEPVDAIIYMITVALGFAAFENALFLLSPLSKELLTQSLITGNMRFIGATLLHTLASSIIGILIAIFFYRGHRARDIAAAIGILLATSLHALFNFSIIELTDSNEGLMSVFLTIWVGIIVLIIFFEKVKRMRRPYRLSS